MKNSKKLDQNFNRAAWGVGLTWIGILWLIPGDQNNVGLLGLGIILLGFTLARSINKFTINIFMVALGILAAGLGLFSLLRPLLNVPPFEVDIIPLLLIAFGLYLFIPAPKELETS